MSFRFQTFPVYKDIKEFIKGIFIITARFSEIHQYDLSSQVKRAAISVALNLAEGSGRGTDKEFNRFIMISIASADETIAGLDIARDNGLISEAVYCKFYDKAESIRNQLGGLSKKLKNTFC